MVAGSRQPVTVSLTRFFALAIWSLIIMALALNMLAVTALASSEGAEAPRRIDTSDVNSSADIRALGEGAAEEGHEAQAEAPEEGHGEVKAEGEAGHGAVEGEATEEAHHPAWMIPGWQTIFTILAVAYFALAVAVLPRVMAKEEHH